MSTTPDEQEVLRQRHERKMQLQRERRQRQREARERPESARESGIEKQLRLIAENSIKHEKDDPDGELLDEEDEDEEGNDQEMSIINGNYGREIRELFQQIEDPEERAKLRRARRAQMQRLRRKRIREQAAASATPSGQEPDYRRSMDMETESASRSMASSPGANHAVNQMLSFAEELKLEKQRADTRERQRRRRARLSEEKREQELLAGRERQRRRRARLTEEKREQEREASRIRMQRRREMISGGGKDFGSDLDDLDDLDGDSNLDMSQTGLNNNKLLKGYGTDLSDEDDLLDEDLGNLSDDDKSNSVSINGKFNSTYNMDENTFTLLLIKHISKEPSLYDITNENYTNDNLRHRAFMRIQERLEKEGATLPQATSVRDKFRILKRRFISEHEKYGSESKWSLYKPLKFMIPYVEATNLRKRAKPLGFKRKLDSPSPGQNDRLDVKAFLENLSQVKLKFHNEYSRASSSNQFDDYDNSQDSDEKQRFNALFRPWLASHPSSSICTRQQYSQILSALRQKKRGEEFTGDQLDEYNLSCRFVLQVDGMTTVVISKATDKQVVCEDEVYDVMLQTHLATNHGRRETMSKRLAGYDGLAVSDLITMFLKCCSQCDQQNGDHTLQRSSSFYENQNSLDGDSSNYNLSMFLGPTERGRLQNGNGHQSPSQGSSGSNTEYEIPAMVAYKIRQTYIFMRVLKTNKPVLCKANDEDFFPPHKINTTAADRASWTAGQIITAYFDFDQKETECVIESVGDREVVQEFFQNVIVQEALQKRKDSSASAIELNGVEENGEDISSAVRQLIFPKQTETLQQNGHTETAWDNDSPPPLKIARLDSTLSSRQIISRFEELEKRLRAVEKLQLGGAKIEQKPAAGIHVQIDGQVFDLREAPAEELGEELERQRQKLMEECPLTINDRNLYLEFSALDLLHDFRIDTSAFATKVLALLIDEQTFRQAQMPSLTREKKRGKTENPDLRSLNSEVVETYKKLLHFMAGSAVCADSLSSWLNSVHDALVEAQNSQSFDYPEMGTEPVFTPEQAFQSTINGGEEQPMETNKEEPVES